MEQTPWKERATVRFEHVDVDNDGFISTIPNGVWWSGLGVRYWIQPDEITYKEQGHRLKPYRHLPMDLLYILLQANYIDVDKG